MKISHSRPYPLPRPHGIVSPSSFLESQKSTYLQVFLQWSGWMNLMIRTPLSSKMWCVVVCFVLLKLTISLVSQRKSSSTFLWENTTGVFHKPRRQLRGEGVSQMTILLLKSYFINWITKGRRGSKIPKKLTTWFMDDPTHMWSDGLRCCRLITSSNRIFSKHVNKPSIGT